MAAQRTPKPAKSRVVASSPAKRRRGSSGSVARALLDQAPQTTQQNAAGFMKAGGIDSYEPTPTSTVRPAPATGTAGDRAPDGRPAQVRRARRRG